MGLRIAMPDAARERNTHVGIAAAAGLLALTRRPGSAWRLPLTTVAAVEVARATLTWKSDERANAAAAELVRSAGVNGVAMRWEDQGIPSQNAPPVIMVHALPRTQGLGAT